MRSLNFLPFCAAFLFLLLCLSNQSTGTAATAQESRLRILVTNDDGIESEGIYVLAKELEKFAEVLVVAPESECSGAGASLPPFTTKRHPDGRYEYKFNGRLTSRDRHGSFFGYAINGTPALAVRVAVASFGREKKFDLVVSGINSFSNLGEFAVASGTIGAVISGASLDVPGIAISHTRDDYHYSARFAAHLIQEATRRGLHPNTVLTVNIPKGDIKGVRTAPLGDSSILKLDPIELEADPQGFKFKMFYSTNRESTQAEGTDLNFFYRKNYITITPLSVNRTDYEMFATVSGWDLSLPEGN